MLAGVHRRSGGPVSTDTIRTHQILNDFPLPTINFCPPQRLLGLHNPFSSLQHLLIPGSCRDSRYRSFICPWDDQQATIQSNSIWHNMALASIQLSPYDRKKCMVSLNIRFLAYTLITERFCFSFCLTAQFSKSSQASLH